MNRVRTHALIALLAIAPLGCSFGYSSESSGKTIASPFTSSSSSSPGDSKQAYGDDIRDYTYAYVVSRHDLETYEKGLGDIARLHGITNWQEDEMTYVAIGAGLARAKASSSELERFASGLAGSDQAKASLIRQGYGTQPAA
jgi:hypothetical protein